jgi:hypothetical protein
VNRCETDIHSFIIKIWLEETVEEAGQVTWRGHITHVVSGQRRYIQDLEDITTFIQPYLGEMGVRPGLGWRVKACWQRWLKERRDR